jgi:hypothetical protein
MDARLNTFRATSYVLREVVPIKRLAHNTPLHRNIYDGRPKNLGLPERPVRRRRRTMQTAPNKSRASQLYKNVCADSWNCPIKTIVAEV